MLQILREKAQGWIAWVIVGLIAMTFILFGAGSIFSPSREGKPLAKINDEKIYEMTLERAFKRVINQMPPEQVQQVSSKQLREDILNDMIRDIIVSQKINALGFDIKNERILQTLQTLPVFNESGFTQESYQRFLGYVGMDHNEFLQELSNRLRMQQLQQGVSQSALLSDWEVDAFLRLRDQQRDIYTYTIQSADFVKQVKISDKDIEEYYFANRGKYFAPEHVSIEYILVSEEDITKDFKPSKEQIEGFYQQNKYLYNDPARVKVAHILVTFDKNNADSQQEAEEKIKAVQDKLGNGESFAKLAEEYSDDIQSAKEGGGLSWIGLGETTPVFEKAAFALTKNSAISSVIETEFGYHIIQLQDKEEEQLQPLAKVRDDVLKRLTHHWGQEQLTGITDDMITLTFDYADTLQPVADKIDRPIQTTALFTQTDGPADEALNHPSVVRAAFSHEVKDAGNNSELLKLDDEHFVVLRVKQVQPQRAKDLAEVKTIVASELVEQQIRELAQQKAEQVLADINEGMEPVWVEHNQVTRSKADLDDAVRDRAFIATVDSVESVSLDTGDKVIVKVNNIQPGDPAKVNDTERKMLQRFLEQNVGQMEYYLLVKSWEQQADIERM